MKNLILKTLRAKGYKVLYIKDIYLLENGKRLSRAQAMGLAGIKAKPRQQKTKQNLYGDFAWIAAINKIKT